MDNENTGLTRSEVEAMIQAAFVSHRGSDGKIYATTKDEKVAIAQDNQTEWEASSFVGSAPQVVPKQTPRKPVAPNSAQLDEARIASLSTPEFAALSTDDILQGTDAEKKWEATPEQKKYMQLSKAFDDASKSASQPAVNESNQTGVLGGGERQKTMGQDNPMGVATPSNEVAQARSVMGGGKRQTTMGREGSMGRARSGLGQGTAKAQAPEVEAPISKDVAEAIRQTAEGMAKTFVTQGDLNNALGGIHPAILNQNRGDQNSAGGVGPMVLTLPMVTSQGDVSAAWEPAAGGIDPTLDYSIVGQNQVTIPAKTTDFLQILFDTQTASWVGSMPTTQPANGVVIDVTKNRFYFSGNFAG